MMITAIETGSAEWHLWRSYVYLFLARLYRQEPDSELLRMLGEQAALDDMFAGIDSLAQTTAALAADVAAHAGQPAVYQERLAADYNRLFVGPGPLAAPPWESVYRSRERLVFGEQTLAVRECYRSFGLASKRQKQEPDDHMALELEFVAWLCRQAAEAADQEEQQRFLEGQQLFLTGHILQWAPALCKDLQQGAETAFYRYVAELTLGWLTAESKYRLG